MPVAFPGQDSDGDGRARRIQPATQKIAARIFDFDLIAALGAALDALHGLGKYPRVPGPDWLDMSRLQHDARHGRGPSTSDPKRPSPAQRPKAPELPSPARGGGGMPSWSC